MLRARSRRSPAGSATLGLALVCLGAVARLAADDWPEWRGKGRTGVWTETGIVNRLPAGGLTAVWRTPINAGYAGPAVARGRVFVTDAQPAGAKRNQMIERAVALDERSGAVLWTHDWSTNYSGLQLVYAIGPRATPTVDDDRVFVLGTMGHLVALHTETGRVLWEKDYVRDFDASVPAWGMAGAPLVDGDRLICLVGGEPDAKLVALDKRTGEEIWRALPSDSEPGYNQPIIIDAGGDAPAHPVPPERHQRRSNPATGTVYWDIDHSVQMGIVVATPVQSGPSLFVTSQYGGARMFRLDPDKPAASLLWSGLGEQDPGMTHDTPDTLNSVIGTPVIDGDYVYGLDNDGQLRCLSAATGKLVWKIRRAAQGARHVRHGVLRAPRRSLLHQQRPRRARDRPAVAARLSGNRPRQADRPDAPVRAAALSCPTSCGRTPPTRTGTSSSATTRRSSASRWRAGRSVGARRLRESRCSRSVVIAGISAGGQAPPPALHARSSSSATCTWASDATASGAWHRCEDFRWAADFAGFLEAVGSRTAAPSISY